MLASIGGVLMWNAEAEPQERRTAVKRKRGRLKEKASGCLCKMAGLGYMEARRTKTNLPVICTLEREGAC